MPGSSRKKKYDYTLLAALSLLLLAGLVILQSTSAWNGEVKFNDPYYYLKKQVFATTIGIAAMFVTANMDYHALRRFALPAYLAAVLLSVAVLLVGDEYNGSRRWLSLGPFSFQPSEFAKVAVILFLADLVTKCADRVKKMRVMAGIMILVLPVAGLVGASNLSTAIIILGIPPGAAGHLEKPGGLREGLPDSAGALRHRLRGTFWPWAGKQCAEAGICPGGPERHDLLHHL